MPRRPRVEMAGCHHVVNRGVERREIYLEPEDYEKFLEIVCDVCRKYNVTLHSYCLMTNHYHLLIETEEENLSKVMRAINAQYAGYFNRKNKRIGHLWQGRFKSWFITDEAYLYTLIKYIEFNPLQAKMVETLYAYPYGSFQMFCTEKETLECLKESVMFTQFKNREERLEFFESWYDESILKEIVKASNLVISSVPTQTLSEEFLVNLFTQCSTKQERDLKVKEAVKMGYSQQQIATVLGISQPAVSLIVKKTG